MDFSAPCSSLSLYYQPEGLPLTCVRRQSLVPEIRQDSLLAVYEFKAPAGGMTPKVTVSLSPCVMSDPANFGPPKIIHWEICGQLRCMVEGSTQTILSLILFQEDPFSRSKPTE